MSQKHESTQSRQQQILAAAAQLFAEFGYYKTTTAHIARTAGVTQPYIFHFFKSKEELYLAVLDQATQRINYVFTEVNAPRDMLHIEMGNAFKELLESDRNEILLTMMAYTIPEPTIRDTARDIFSLIYDRVKSKLEQAGIPNADDEASRFIGQGLTIALAETVNLPELLPWFEHDKK
ncbi:TetR/AcrR family transcriptional regulator [Pseudogracilibacillus auburnensis]|uniref:TetR family transcriptional regulator n=1 Tax=Pseudogracilibacillus auburnensis TaxID=1494959 RepID=A0A2V3W8X2_9BACI|nr:TetR/AcrR family transcriptional regulator [Pseudogracilibacillus auburnensis]MBO1001141.1 TetR/AcrR family transcriptional regulator [Pseudogracilibacillus auburnensis]PXW90572.1 TetR family transcriptional regulator [Pseudogracilibacillus auburnensis]